MRYACFAVALALAAQPRGMTPQESVDFRALGEVAASANSAALLYQAGQQWLTLGSSEPVAAVPRGASNLLWSPDGKRLAFFGGDALWVLDWGSKRVIRVCDYGQSNAFLSQAGNRLAWSPDGLWLAFAGTLDPPSPAQDPIVITRVLYKSRTALSDNRRTHIYVVPAGGGTPKLLTPGGRDQHSLDWTAGEEIVFLSNPEPDPDTLLNYDIHAVNPSTGAIRQITKTPGVEMYPRISPDGKTIAYTATTRRITTIDSVAEDAHVWLVPLAGGAARQLNPKLDRRCMAPQWDGNAVLYLAQDQGKTTLYRDLERLIDREASIGNVTTHQGKLYFALNDPLRPRELWAQDGPVTNIGNPSQWTLSKPEQIRYRSFDGTEIQGWLYPPLGVEGKWPLILSIHGGPHGMYGYSFTPSAQVFAARGYATLMINPRGSSGYGQVFSDGCVNNWGGGDYKDLMAGVDYVLKKYPQVDPQRLGVMGGSYGGFMTNWVVTQTSRFRAAVSIASVSNLISFYATSLYQDLIHAEFDGYPWEGENYSKLWTWSPLKYIKNVKTPTMLIHGQQDNDVHLTQAEEMYTAMRQQGVEAELVIYPREGHRFREPKHQVDRLERSLKWFDRFLQP
jgi:dipeptidyl aminopeptidase/acylaminoacyl peptidase